jgi:hypothetical protein
MSFIYLLYNNNYDNHNSNNYIIIKHRATYSVL